MRVLFDALLLVSQAAEILHVVRDKRIDQCLRSLLTGATSFWTAIVYALTWRLRANHGANGPGLVLAVLSLVVLHLHPHMSGTCYGNGSITDAHHF